VQKGGRKGNLWEAVLLPGRVSAAGFTVVSTRGDRGRPFPQKKNVGNRSKVAKKASRTDGKSGGPPWVLAGVGKESASVLIRRGVQVEKGGGSNFLLPLP